jgi:hypothetical protein
VDLPARCRSATRSFSGRVRNLSQGGLMLVVEPPADDAAARELALEIDLPDSAEPISIEGEICWRAALGAAGIRITHIPAVARRRLANWILRAHHGASEGSRFVD